MPRGGAVMCVGRSGGSLRNSVTCSTWTPEFPGNVCAPAGSCVATMLPAFHVDAEVCPTERAIHRSCAIARAARQGGSTGNFLQPFLRVHRRTHGTVRPPRRFGRGCLGTGSRRASTQDRKARRAGPASTTQESSALESVVASPVVTQTPTLRPLVPPLVTQGPTTKASPTPQPRNRETQPVFTAPGVAAASPASPLTRASEALTRVSAAITAGLYTELRNERRWRYAAVREARS